MTVLTGINLDKKCVGVGEQPAITSPSYGRVSKSGGSSLIEVYTYDSAYLKFSLIEIL